VAGDLATEDRRRRRQPVAPLDDAGDSRDVPGMNKVEIAHWVADWGEDSDFVRHAGTGGVGTRGEGLNRASTTPSRNCEEKRRAVE
jgi:hypothetical protein